MSGSRFARSALAAAVGVFLAACPSPNHFTVYEVERIEVDHQVFLTGQFETAPVAAHARFISHFANPAEKVHAGGTSRIGDENAHLTAYVIDQPTAEPRRTVRFKNQFGQHSVDIQDPRLLLVPTQKTSDPGSGFPDGLDHYKCYEVVRLNTVPALPGVTLTDQFTSHQVQVGPPRFFCLPVAKRRPGGEEEPIQDRENHLTVYELPAQPHEVTIKTLDQFGERELRVRQLLWLAVPTQKQVAVPHP